MFTFLSTNRLPDERESQDKTIFVISSSNTARVFIIENHDINELAPLSTDRIDHKYEEKEGFTFTRNKIGTTVATNIGFKEKESMHDDPIFVKYITEEIQKIDQKYQSDKIIIHAPEGLNTLFTKAFSNVHTDKVTVHAGNHMKIGFPQLFDLIKE